MIQEPEAKAAAEKLLIFANGQSEPEGRKKEKILTPSMPKSNFMVLKKRKKEAIPTVVKKITNSCFFIFIIIISIPEFKLGFINK